MQKIKYMVLMIFIMLFCASCADVTYKIEINDDGSANFIYLIDVSKDEYEIYKKKYETTINSIKDNLEQNGFSVNIYEKENVIIFEAKLYLENIEKIEEFDTLFLASNERVPAIVHKKNLLTEIYEINGMIDLTTYSDSATDLEKDEMISEMLPIKLIIKSPIGIKESNADEIVENELIWNLKYGEENTIVAKYRKNNYALISISCILVFVIVQFIAYKITKKILSRKKDND